MGLRIAVLVKQVPRVEEMELSSEGVLRRDGVDLELNPYCRRAVSKGAELAEQTGGSCTVLTLGPPQAEDCLREAVAWGATRGMLVTDPAFAGSDTLATARTLAAALTRTGPYDLVLVGRNSVDADTGQVGPTIAELLDLPFLGGVKKLSIDGGAAGAPVRATCEQDDRVLECATTLPAVLSCAERLCDPAKIDPAGRAEVPAERITRLSAADLGAGPWGQAGSPTTVGAMRVHDDSRRGVRLEGPLGQQVRAAVALLIEAGALHASEPPAALCETVADGWERGDRRVVVVVEPGRPRVAWELLGAAAALAREVGGRVTAAVVDTPGSPDLDPLGLRERGADELILLRAVAPAAPEADIAAALGDWCTAAAPWSVLLTGTMWGREVAGRLAARLGAGLVGDAIDLTIEDGRLVAWKPAFGGKVVAAVHSSSPVQLVTVRPGVLGLHTPRAGHALASTDVPVASRGQVRVLSSEIEDEMDELAAATCVIGVGRGIAPQEYVQLDPLRRVLGAELAATRKVTDVGWLPHARQVGITGRSIAPRLYVAIGMGGKFNHMAGVRRAHCILAINSDPDALVFAGADVGIVGDWREVVPMLAATIETTRALPVGA